MQVRRHCELSLQNPAKPHNTLPNRPGRYPDRSRNGFISVNQIERFYAKRLPISRELMENLQSFGG